MADRDDEPSLELPSLGGWRRRRRTARAEAPVEPVPVEPVPVEPVPVEQAPAPEPAPAPAPAPSPAEHRPRRRPAIARPAIPRPAIPRPEGLLAVVLVGGAAGLVLVALTWASLQACEEVRGTSSCGNAGYPMLVVALVAAVLAGVGLLRLAQAPDPVTVSVLGVGLAAVLALLLLVDRLDRPAMVVVIPLICAATFAAAQWLSSTFEDAGRG